MGAEQSAPRDGQAAAAPRKTCYYELLGVERTATEEEIRRAYKRKALELHPDRNLNDIENATKRFAEVQAAYEVLIDPQERAWYDSHRDAILSGEDDVAAEGVPPSDKSFANHTSANAIFALMSRFNSAVPMDDSPRGFFGILNEFFDQLAAEETAACQWAGITPTEYPPFGKSTDDYNTVAKRFYNVWSSFSTKKSFSWRDKYRLSDAPDRRIRRLMEKENKKFREEGIREYNDAVISLVAFVKKRDPRYVPNTQSEAERQQMLRNSAAAQAARQRAANQEKLAEFVLPEWAQSRNDEDNQHYDEYSMSEEEDEVEEIECVVCNKSFKSEKQFEAHEKSKKHIKAVQQLKRQMRKENAHLELDEEEPGPSPSIQTPQEDEDEDNQEPEATAGSTKTKEGEEVKPSTGKPPQSPQQQDESESSFEDEYAPRSVVEERILNGPGKKKKPSKPGEDIAESAAVGLDDLTLDDDTKPAEGGGKKIGKAKLKREKKAARQAAAEAEAAGASHKCARCSETFTSRTKLFDHIREFGHAAPVPVSNSKSGGGKKKKR